MLQELYADKEAVREIDRFRNHIRFQELFYTLFQQELLEQPVKTDTRAAVERSIELLHRAYQEELTVERLAKEANIGRWQYTNLFKQLTGKSPIDYLTDIRIQRAKELLLTSDCKLREIAVLVGYRDEYYFNRRFRQTVGVSPKRYIQSMRQSLKVATLQYAGEMLALGMKPVAATDAMIGNYADALSGVTTIGDYNFNPNRLAEVKPDLVLAPDYWSHQELEKMTKLAPVAVVPWEDDVFERLRAIARLLGKQREAKSWLARYAAKAKQAKQRTAGAIRKGETALILAVSGTEISFLGARNVGQTIYHVIGFHPPKPIEHLIRQDSCFSGGELAIEELSRLETDRIFVVVNDNEHASTTLAQLLASEQWRSHKAVGKGMVYMLDKRWMWYDPHTLEWQIGEAVRMLAR
nr:AraC family transcriptional regulator [Paenibacillus phyllosphaerae]